MASHTPVEPRNLEQAAQPWHDVRNGKRQMQDSGDFDIPDMTPAQAIAFAKVVMLLARVENIVAMARSKARDESAARSHSVKIAMPSEPDKAFIAYADKIVAEFNASGIPAERLN